MRIYDLFSLSFSLPLSLCFSYSFILFWFTFFLSLFHFCFVLEWLVKFRNELSRIGLLFLN